MITTIDYNQHTIIEDIIKLHVPDGIQLDPTYSKGVFYKKATISPPEYKFDILPQSDDVIKASAESLPLENNSIKSIMFDPPFIVGVKGNTSIIGNRFGSFKNIKSLWEWYDLCLMEFYRLLVPGGKLVFKCQDTVSANKQWLSHVHIINEAERCQFYTKDLFVLLAKNRLVGHNHKNQKHARKFHSYFIVFEK